MCKEIRRQFLAVGDVVGLKSVIGDLDITFEDLVSTILFDIEMLIGGATCVVHALRPQCNIAIGWKPLEVTKAKGHQSQFASLVLVSTNHTPLFPILGL